MPKVAPDFDTSEPPRKSRHEHAGVSAAGQASTLEDTQSKIDQRKADHIKINLEQDVRSALTTGLENFHFIHEALPELDLNRIDTTLKLFDKLLAAPILIWRHLTETAGIDPAEIAHLVTFISSPLASAINGAALRVDGGLVRSVF